MINTSISENTVNFVEPPWALIPATPAHGITNLRKATTNTTEHKC